jgi:hypothetical protein
LNSQTHEPRGCSAVDLSAECGRGAHVTPLTRRPTIKGRNPKRDIERTSASKPILTKVFRIVFFTWLLVTGLVLWVLK